MTEQLKSVSYVMPVLNEEKHLARAVESIFAQEQTGETDVVISVGPSSDKTQDIADDLAKRFPVKVVANPTGKTPAGLNAAIAAAKHDVIVRVDAHSELSPGYTKLAVEVLNETGADNVGGVMKAVGETPIQQAVAWAYMSRLGLGGGTFHVGGKAGPSDSVYLGVFRRSALERTGGFDERMIRGQDWELNLRIRESGGVVWFDPRLEVTYHPRSKLSRLAKQFFDTGIWRATLTKMSPGRANLRYFAPPALVAGSILGLALWLTTGWTLGILPAAAYTFAVAAAALTAKNLSLPARIGLLVVLPTMHYCWGSGFIRGLLK